MWRPVRWTHYVTYCWLYTDAWHCWLIDWLIDRLIAHLTVLDGLFLPKFTTDALWDKDKSFRFLSQKVKVEGHGRIKYAVNSSYCACLHHILNSISDRFSPNLEQWCIVGKTWTHQRSKFKVIVQGHSGITYLGNSTWSAYSLRCLC